MKGKDVMILLGVVGVLYMARSTPTISHEEQLSADGIEFARYNRERYERLTPQQKLYENVSYWTNWNASKVNASKTNASKANATRRTEF